MATTSKSLFRGAAATSSSTLYTVPNTSTTTVVTNIAIANTATSAATVTINLDGIAVLSDVSVEANSTAFIDLKQVLNAANPAKVITGEASATTVNFHISGVEIS